MKVADWRKTCWQDLKGNKVTVEEILAELHYDPVVEIKLADLSHIPSTHIEEHRKSAADLSFPIIVQEKYGEYQSILDGHHRRQKAVDENRTNILAWVYKGELFNESR